MIKYQTGKIYLAATVKIGRRLTVAKALLKEASCPMLPTATQITHQCAI
ncbi:DUF3102 domain-containing protein [Dehalobacter sp. 4CP]